MRQVRGGPLKRAPSSVSFDLKYADKCWQVCGVVPSLVELRRSAINSPFPRIGFSEPNQSIAFFRHFSGIDLELEHESWTDQVEALAMAGSVRLPPSLNPDGLLRLWALDLAQWQLALFSENEATALVAYLERTMPIRSLKRYRLTTIPGGRMSPTCFARCAHHLPWNLWQVEGYPLAFRSWALWGAHPTAEPQVPIVRWEPGPGRG